MYKNIDFNKLFNNESEFAKKYNHEKLTDNRIKEVEELLEYKLPKSYIELLKVQNGGYINKKYEKCWLTAIYGIGANDKSFYGLEEQFKLYKEEGEYPDIGIPFGETQSGGHDMYFIRSVLAQVHHNINLYSLRFLLPKRYIYLHKNHFCIITK